MVNLLIKFFEIREIVCAIDFLRKSGTYHGDLSWDTTRFVKVSLNTELIGEFAFNCPHDIELGG